MNRAPGTENQCWTVTCQDAADMIVPLPDDLLSEICHFIGDILTVEKPSDGTIMLTPVRS